MYDATSFCPFLCVHISNYNGILPKNEKFRLVRLPYHYHNFIWRENASAFLVENDFVGDKKRSLLKLIIRRVIPWSFYHFLEVFFDFDFDPPVYQKTVRKACSKKKVTNLSHKFRAPITKTRYMYEISKVSSRFGYFFLTFAPSICVICRI
jgi:hypothetical protein